MPIRQRTGLFCTLALLLGVVVFSTCRRDESPELRAVRVAVEDYNTSIQSSIELKRFQDRVGQVVVYSVHSRDGRVFRVTVRDGQPLAIREVTD